MKVIKPIEGIDVNKRIYTCSICESWFNWGKETYWYGSYKNLENDPSKIIYCCSDKCKQQHDNDKNKAPK